MRILLFGDISGIPQLLRHVPPSIVVGVVGASIRPQYLEPLAGLAAGLDVPFLTQPKWLSREYEAFRGQVAALAPDLIFVNSYSMIVRDDVLILAQHGGVNIHGASLPRYRGCNPLQWAIINGESETGVTLHEMTAGLDEGPIIDQRVVPLLFEDTWLTARARVAAATDDLIVANLPGLLAGTWSSRPQDDAQATYGRRRTPADGEFDWDRPVVDIYNLVRALLPPLPPAFYLDAGGHKRSLATYFTPSQIAALKYGSEGGRRLTAEGVRLRPMPTTRMDQVECAIQEVEGGREIGSCQLRDIDWQQRSALLKVRIEDAGWRAAVGPEVVRLLGGFGITELGLLRIDPEIPGKGAPPVDAVVAGKMGGHD